MSRFAGNDTLQKLVDNSYKAIDDGAYNVKQRITHDPISLRRAIKACNHAPLITEVKFSSPSRGQIRIAGTPAEIAVNMVNSGAIGLSVLTQPYMFDGSMDNLIKVRKAVSAPILMKDITVSEVQIDAGKQAGADLILLIKTVFDRNLAETSMEKLFDYATRKEMQVLVEVHTGHEYDEVLKPGYELVGINNRNLSDLKVDLANTENLIKKYGKAKSIVISESGISKPADIQYLRKAGADAFLVGTSIMETGNVSAKVAELYNAL